MEKNNVVIVLATAVFVLAACTPGGGEGSPVPVERPTVPPTERGTPALGETPDPVSTVPQVMVITEVTSLPLDWPLIRPSGTQIREVRACDFEAGMNERYSNNVAIAGLKEAYPLETACDWAILAAEYMERAAGGYSEAGYLAWATAVSANPAYAFSDPLFSGFIEGPDVVAGPPFSDLALVGVEINYSWSGLGESVDYEVIISEAYTNPVVEGTVNGEAFMAEISVETVAELGHSLTGLFPVLLHPSLVVCYDNFPDWMVTLTFEDGTSIHLFTEESNVYGFGGPWWVDIDGDLYMQFSATFIEAMNEVVIGLELPVGQPAAQTCHGLESPMLDLMYGSFG